MHGWLVINKEEGITSARVVAAVKRITGASKVGHAGTLDPLASGVLPLALGEATKTMSYVVMQEKEYTSVARFGEARDTEDREGSVIGTTSNIPTEQVLRSVLPNFMGSILQVPSAYSAIKMAGKRAYALAREGSVVKLLPRSVDVYDLSLAGMDAEQYEALFKVRCGKGVYIRALVRDIAHAAGSLAYVRRLERTKVGKFSLENAISLDNLERIMHNRTLYSHLLAVDSVLDDIPALIIDTDEIKQVRNGVAIVIKDASLVSETIVRLCTLEAKLVAIGRVELGKIWPTRVFNY